MDVITLATQLVRIPSLTPVTPELLPAAAQTLELLQRHAAASHGRSTRLPSEGGHEKWPYRVDNLYTEWLKGSPKRLLVFMGHTDVVAPGNEAAWSVPPFAGAQRNGYLYGRGTTDMKGAVAAFFSAAARAMHTCLDVHVAAITTTDEEWAAVNGSRHVLAWMKQDGKKPHGFLVGEPSTPEVFGRHIKLGRRGSLNGHLQLKGTQGHAAYPGNFDNPNPALALATTIISTLKWNDGSPVMPATNLEVVSLQSGSPSATAVIPGEARGYWNVRFTPQQTPEKLVRRIRDALAKPPAWARNAPFAQELANIEVVANLHSVSLPYQSRAGALARASTTAIREVCKSAPTPDCFGGATDGRFVAPVFPGAEVVEVGPPEQGGKPDNPHDAYGTVGGMHQVDERIRLADLQALEEVYYRIIRAYCAV